MVNGNQAQVDASMPPFFYERMLTVNPEKDPNATSSCTRVPCTISSRNAVEIFYPQVQKNDGEDEDQTKKKKTNANGVVQVMNGLNYEQVGSKTVCLSAKSRIDPEILEILSTAAKHGSTIMIWVALFVNWYFTQEGVVNYAEVEKKLREEEEDDEEEEEEEEAAY